MPIYEYRCESCGEGFEILMSISEMESAKGHVTHSQDECDGMMHLIPSLPTIRPNGMEPSGSDAPALHNTGNRARRLWMNPDGTTKEQAEWRPAFDGDPGRVIG